MGRGLRDRGIGDLAPDDVDPGREARVLARRGGDAGVGDVDDVGIVALVSA